MKDRASKIAILKENSNNLIVSNTYIEEGKFQYTSHITRWFMLLDIEKMKIEIDEMTNLATMKQEKDVLMVDIQDTEIRIALLRKQLGVSFNIKSY